MSKKPKQLLTSSINLLVVLGSLSVNIYLPSLPMLEKVFSTSLTHLKLSITLFLIGYAFSQFFWGSISEHFGRKKPVVWGLTAACIGSIIGMLAQNVTTLIIARFIEGAGIGCATVLGRAILTDSFNKDEISRASAFMVISSNIIPALAPLIGGYLLYWFGWRAIFLFLIIYTGCIITLFSLKIKESHKNIKKKYGFTHAFKEYREVLKNHNFIWYLLPYTLLAGGMIAYYTATPFIFITALHVAAHTYSYFSIVTVGAYVIGAYLCHYITQKFGLNQTVFGGIAICLLSGVALILCSIFSSLGIFTVILPMALYSFGVSIVAPNGNAGAMYSLSHIAGAAAATLGASGWGFAAIFSYIINLLNLNNLYSLAFFISAISLLSLLTFFIMPHKDEKLA